ncbi:MAG: ribonuclease H-like YkuK family protein [Patescibacteria group bacterium]|mgnify:CR=1 FL=1
MSNINYFHNGRGEKKSLEEVIEEIMAYIASRHEASYEITVGTDSAARDLTFFVTAIVVRRRGNGAIYFWRRSAQEKVASLQDRIWKEAIASLTLAQELRGRLRQIAGDEAFWAGNLEVKHIHLDMGQHGPTRNFLDGVEGMVKGYGFEPVIKPFSYAAFAVADLHT